MRVLLISKACVVGAYQTKLEELARYPDMDLHVIVPPYWREGNARITLERAHTSGYRLHVEPMALNGHFHSHFYPFLGHRIRELRPDIVHMDEEPYNLATWLALRAAAHHHARALFFTWQNLQRTYPVPFRWFERENYRRAHYALAGNNEAVQVLRAKGYSGPVKVIAQFGVDPNLYRSLPERHAVRHFTIGYVGRLVPEKGVHLLLEAAAKLDGDWRLEIVGDGPERASLQALATEQGISARVSFVPRIPSTDVPARLNRFDVLVLPSLSRPNWKEQFGRILIEAMACETPVLGADSGEIPNVIGNAGLIFPEGDVTALRAYLQRLCEDTRLRADLGAAGRQRVLAHYTQSRIAALTYSVYQEMLGR